jgi:hypothetical protein
MLQYHRIEPSPQATAHVPQSYKVQILGHGAKLREHDGHAHLVTRRPTRTVVVGEWLIPSVMKQTKISLSVGILQPSSYRNK